LVGSDAVADLQRLDEETEFSGVLSQISKIFVICGSHNVLYTAQRKAVDIVEARSVRPAIPVPYCVVRVRIAFANTTAGQTFLIFWGMRWPEPFVQDGSKIRGIDRLAGLSVPIPADVVLMDEWIHKSVSTEL
jgi:hypothetical protein